MNLGTIDFAAASISKAQSATEMKVAASVTKMAMESAEVEANAIQDMMPPVSPPGMGKNIDTRA